MLCLCYVDDNLEVYEELIGLYSLKSTSADVVVTVNKDILLHMNLTINNHHDQCYDGGSNMSGARSGVATTLTDLGIQSAIYSLLRTCFKPGNSGCSQRCQGYGRYSGYSIRDHQTHKEASQAATLSAREGQQLVLVTFQAIRTDECFDLHLETRRSSADVSSPTLSQCRKVPWRFEVGESIPEHPTTAQDH